MILTIAGTSGSGKSHLMRSFISWAERMAPREDEFKEGRTAPLGYAFDLEDKDVFVVGAYDVPTGGCDGFSNVSEVFDLVRQKHDEGYHVLYEGLFVMNMTRGPKLASTLGKELVVLQLATPFAVCKASVDQRRALKGKEGLENTTNMEGNYRRATNYCTAMRDAGAKVVRVTRDKALDKMIELLGFA